MIRAAIIATLCALPMQCASTFCKGLMVGTAPGLHDIIEDGVVRHDFSFEAEAVPINTFSGEDISHNFYVKKEGIAIKAQVTVESTTTFTEELMHPEVTGDLFFKQKHKAREDETINSTTTDLIVDYHCTDVGGTSIVWLKFDISAEQHQAACGPLADYRDLQIFVLWTKYCSPKLIDRTGLSVGTREGGHNVVFDGQTESLWEFPAKSTDENDAATDVYFNQEIILSAVMNTTFFLQTNDSSTQVFGKPKFENDQSKLIVMLHTAYEGGTAGPDGPELIIVEYLCGQGVDSPVEITMVVDLCDDLIQPKDCREDNNVGFEPLIVHWVKNCGVDDGSISHGLNTPQTVAIVLVVLAFSLCVVGACVRYFRCNKRGADIIPGGLLIEGLAKMCWILTCRRGRYSKASSGDTAGINLSIGKTTSADGKTVSYEFESKAKNSVSSQPKNGFQSVSSSSTYGAAQNANPFQESPAAFQQSSAEASFDEADI